MTKQEALFWQLYNCKNEQEVDELIHQRPDIFAQPNNWCPLGGNTGNYGTVENQAADPIPALVEKLTNSIDAILMRRCYEESIDPKSQDAPQSVDDAVCKFFPQHVHWDLRDPRSEQARSIQIMADGYANNTANASIVIYDDGEGQHPDDFDKTFLSLGRGNKNEIKFVQGVYNMGGCGAITFCGDNRYQLIASKRYDGTGKFGFTLIRKHPLTETEDEERRYKKTWYEYFTINGQIPAFKILELDLGLRNRMFRTGSVIKLYSYDIENNRDFHRDLGRSINEFLFDPVLPITITESKERYPRRKHVSRVLFGLKRALNDSDYVEEKFSQEIIDRNMGKVKVTVYIFKVRANEKDVEQTKKTFRDEYFKNNMSVLFSLNGQVHGHYTSEFISRTLSFSLLKNYVLIHVDCTNMKQKFRDELTMPSRDRFKNSKQMKFLRRLLGEKLRSGRLLDIFKARKNRVSHNSADSEELLKRIAEDLPLDKDMRDLIKQTMELDEPGEKPKPRPPKPPQPPTVPVDLKRYPSFFRLKTKQKDSEPVIAIPLGGSKSMRFESDVQDDYFDRAKDPGDLEFAVLTYRPNDTSGGDQKGTVNSVSEIFTVNKQSPKDGEIRVVFEPTADLKVGDEIEIQADLHSSAAPDGVLSVIFWVSIIKPNKPSKPAPPPPEEEKLGLPQLALVYEESLEDEGRTTWNDLDGELTMGYSVIVRPFVNQNRKLETIYINMDSRVFKDYLKSRYRNPSEEHRKIAEQQYVSRVYYHTLFLYLISRNRNFAVSKLNGDDEYDHDALANFLKDIFDNQYAKFLLSFESSEYSALMDALE